MQLRFILIGILFENAEPIKSCVICIRFYSEIDPYNLKDQGERVGTTLYFRISPKKAWRAFIEDCLLKHVIEIIFNIYFNGKIMTSK